MGALDHAPVAASSSFFAIDRLDISVERHLALSAGRKAPDPIRLGHGAAFVAPLHIAIHRRVKKVEAIRASGG
jgi:hypothetical protein